LFLDFGINSSELDLCLKINPEPTMVNHLTENHVLPREEDLPIKNLYSKYFIFNHKAYKYHQKVRECEDKVDPPSDLNGILISHPHRDHYHGLSFINRNIPIYTGVVTKRIIKASSLCSPPKFDNFLYGLNWIRFRTGNVINIKGLEIFPVHVDHSIPAAYGFILNTSAGIIVYSGDTAPNPKLAAKAKNATLLIHDATFSEGHKDKAKEFGLVAKYPACHPEELQAT